MQRVADLVAQQGWTCCQGYEVGDSRKKVMGTVLGSSQWEGYLMLSRLHGPRPVATFVELIEVDGALLASHPHMLGELPDDVVVVELKKQIAGKVLKDCNPGCAVGDPVLMSKTQMSRRQMQSSSDTSFDVGHVQAEETRV